MPETDPLRARITLEGTGTAGQQLRTLTSQVTSTRQAFINMGAVVGAAVAVFSIREAIRFETAMVGVAKTVDATAEELAALGQTFVDLSEQIPVASGRLAKLGEIAGQLGVQKENIADFVEVMAALGVTTNLSAEEAATSLARFSNIMGTSQEDVGRLGSVIVELGNNLATTEAEIVELGLRIAGAGAQIGLTEAQVLSFAAALSSVGINAEAGGTAISRVFIEIANSVATGGTKLSDFAQIAGKTVEDFRQLFAVDAAEATTIFIEGLGRLSAAGVNVFGVLESVEFQNVRIRDTLLRAAGAGDLLREALQLGIPEWERNNALVAEAEKFYARTAAQLEILKNKASNVAAELGESMLPAVIDAVDLFSILLDLLRPLADAFGALPKPIREAALALVFFQAAAAAAGRVGLVTLAGLLATGGPLIVGLGLAAAGFLAFARELRESLGPIRQAVEELGLLEQSLEDLTDVERQALAASLAFRIEDVQFAVKQLNFLIGAAKAAGAAFIQLPESLGGLTIPLDTARKSVTDLSGELGELWARFQEAVGVLEPITVSLTGSSGFTPAVEDADKQIQPLVDTLRALGQEAGASAKGLDPLLRAALGIIEREAGGTEEKIADLVGQLEEMSEELENFQGTMSGVDLQAFGGGLDLVLRQAINASQGFGDLNLKLVDTTRSSESTLKALRALAGETDDFASTVRLSSRFVIDLVEALGLMDSSLQSSINRLAAMVIELRDVIRLMKDGKASADDLALAIAGIGAQLGNIVGGKAGSAISGAATGAGLGFVLSGGNPIGAVIGGAAGFIGGLFGGGGPDDVDAFTDSMNILLAVLRDSADELQRIASGLGQELLDAARQMDALSIGTKLSKDEAQRLTSFLRKLGIGWDELAEIAAAFGIDISELMNVLINGEGDRELAAAQFNKLNEAITLLPDSLSEAAQAAEEAARKIQEAFRELSEELGDIDFEQAVFGFDAEERFRRVVIEINRALDEMGEFRLAVGDISTAEGREATLASIQALVDSFEGDVPAAIQSAIRQLLAILAEFDREAARAAEEAAGEAGRARQKTEVQRLRRDSQRETEGLREQIRLLTVRGPVDSIARLRVSITEVQANELLSVARTNSFHNMRTAENTAVIRDAVLIIAGAVGGPGLYARVSEHLAGELDSTQARRGILPPVN